MSQLWKGVLLFFMCDVAKLALGPSFEEMPKHSKFGG